MPKSESINLLDFHSSRASLAFAIKYELLSSINVQLKNHKKKDLNTNKHTRERASPLTMGAYKREGESGAERNEKK